MDSTLIQKELESLKEVSEDSSSGQSDNNESVFIKSISKPQKIKIKKENNNNKYMTKNKNKIHCLLKIYEGDSLILSLDFYDNILLPNITLKGNPIPNEILNPEQKQVKGKKDLQVQPDDLSYLSKLTQYKIQCFIEGNDLPKYLQNENTFDWKIQIYSTDIIGFVKDTIREDSERALINSWDKNGSGRSKKAQMARVKFIEERKIQVDSYIQENDKGKY
jgi:hypothetical protein